jgi:GTP-binding protein EngB required for normal cell division
VSEYIDESINRWKKEQVKFAITGRSATGKSTFINTIRNLRPGDDDFAKAGSGNTTITPTLYMHPKNHQITFYDLPGYSGQERTFAQLTQFTDQPYLIFTQDVVKKDEEKIIIRYLQRPGDDNTRNQTRN